MPGTTAGVVSIAGWRPDAERDPARSGLHATRRIVAAAMAARSPQFATQAQFDAGRRFVFLFTDLANPTSNKIYQAIGYAPVIDVEEWRFEPTG